MKARRLITSVMIVEEHVHAGKAFVDVLRSEVVHVIVIPERAHRLLDVTAKVFMRRVHPRKYVWIVMIIKLSRSEEVARVAVRFGRGVTVMQVRRNEVLAEAAIVDGQVVAIADENRSAVALDIKRSRHQTIKAPEWLRR